MVNSIIVNILIAYSLLIMDSQLFISLNSIAVVLCCYVCCCEESDKYWIDTKKSEGLLWGDDREPGTAVVFSCVRLGRVRLDYDVR